MFGYLFSMLYFSWSVNIARFMERQTRRGNYRTVQWNSLGPGFHLKIDAFFIHVYTMGLDLILYWKMHNYPKVILLNLKMFLCA